VGLNTPACHVLAALDRTEELLLELDAGALELELMLELDAGLLLLATEELLLELDAGALELDAGLLLLATEELLLELDTGELELELMLELDAGLLLLATEELLLELDAGALELDAIELTADELLLELDTGALELLELERDELMLELDAGLLLLVIEELLAGAELITALELELLIVPLTDESELLETLLDTGAFELLELVIVALEILELETTELTRLLLEEAGELLAGLDELLVATDELLDTVGVGDDSPPLLPPLPPQAVRTRLSVRDETSVRLRMAAPLWLSGIVLLNYTMRYRFLDTCRNLKVIYASHKSYLRVTYWRKKVHPLKKKPNFCGLLQLRSDLALHIFQLCTFWFLLPSRPYRWKKEKNAQML
jgi:hypothetical protein